MTRRLRQAGRLAGDVATAVRSLLGALPLTVVAPEPEPGLALLEGPSQTRVGTDAAYRVRAYNPTSARRSIDVAVTGWRDGDPAAKFDLGWTAHLESGAIDERWVVTDWRGGAVLLDRAPNRSSSSSERGEASDRWHVEARITGAPRAAVLRAAGDVVA